MGQVVQTISLGNILGARMPMVNSLAAAEMDPTKTANGLQ